MSLSTLAKCVANPNMCVPYILMSSAIYYHGQYYHHRPSPISDSEFDLICEFARQNWGRIHHHHKHLITPEDLAAGTLYGLTWEDYPLRVRSAAYAWMAGDIVHIKIPVPELVDVLRRIADALCRFTLVGINQV